MRSYHFSVLFFGASALLLLSSLTPTTASSAFVGQQRTRIPRHNSRRHRTNNGNNNINILNILDIRGGDTIGAMSSSTPSALSSSIGPAMDALRSTLVSGSPLKAVSALYAVASLVVVPLTWYRTAYSFSVGYGLSVAATASALLYSFDATTPSSFSSAPAILAITTIVYGIRLAAFIYMREMNVESKRKGFDALDSKPVLQRTPLALGVSLLYAFMISPALFAFRGGSSAGGLSLLSKKVQAFFVGVAVFGTALEAIADQHKYEVNRPREKEGAEVKKFVGPTTWSYRLCRHPNYLGEILFWFGLVGAGTVTFGKSIVAWTCGALGQWGILSIMLGSSVRLDGRQAEKYGDQQVFKEWKEKVRWSVIPFVK